MQQAGWKISTSRKHWTWWAPVTTDRDHMTALNEDPKVRGSCKPSQKKNTSQKNWIQLLNECLTLNEWMLNKDKAWSFSMDAGEFSQYLISLLFYSWKPPTSIWALSMISSIFGKTTLPNCSATWQLRHLLIKNIIKAHGFQVLTAAFLIPICWLKFWQEFTSSIDNQVKW